MKSSNLDAGKATRPDRISARLLHMVAPSITPSITSLFNASLVSGQPSIRMEGSIYHTCTQTWWQEELQQPQTDLCPASAHQGARIPVLQPAN